MKKTNFSKIKPGEVFDVGNGHVMVGPPISSKMIKATPILNRPQKKRHRVSSDSK